MPNKLILAPLFSCGIKSEMLAPPSVTGHTPKHPAKNRKAINWFMEPATAHAIVKILLPSQPTDHKVSFHERCPEKDTKWRYLHEHNITNNINRIPTIYLRQRTDQQWADCKAKNIDRDNQFSSGLRIGNGNAEGAQHGWNTGCEHAAC